jgi:hypothetical protein
VRSFREIHALADGLRGDLTRAFAAIGEDPILGAIGATPYPYDTLHVMTEFMGAFPAELDAMIAALPNNWVVDVGGAHGEISFLFDRAGFRVTYVDVIKEGHAFPHIAAALAETLDAGVDVTALDIDETADFSAATSGVRARLGPEARFGLAFFSGVFYHLKNPFGVLERLRGICSYCLMTTQTFSHLDPTRPGLADEPLGYVLKDRELNADPTNYFLFTMAGLRVIVERAGFEMAPDGVSLPGSIERRERAFLLLRARY